MSQVDTMIFFFSPEKHRVRLFKETRMYRAEAEELGKKIPHFTDGEEDWESKNVVSDIEMMPPSSIIFLTEKEA